MNIVEFHYRYCNLCGAPTDGTVEFSTCCGARIYTPDEEIVPEADVTTCIHSLRTCSLQQAIPDFYTNERSAFTRADDETSSMILAAIQQAGEDFTPRSMPFHAFISRPWALGATTLSTGGFLTAAIQARENLRASASNIETLNARSRVIDKILAGVTNVELTAAERVLQCKLKFMHRGEKSSLYISAKPDAWLETGNDLFIIEFKSVWSSPHATSDQLNKWAHQIAAYQLKTARTHNNRYLLGVTFMSEAEGELTSQLVVLEVKPDNLERCKDDWALWLDEYPPEHLQLLKDYNKPGSDITFHNLRDEVNQMLVERREANRALHATNAAQTVATTNRYGVL